MAIAERMGLSAESRMELRVASSLHDLGKIAVPTEILSKPGKLTDLEFAIIKTHPQVAYNILKPLDFPKQINQIIMQHHERLNGSGYPYGLAGREIMLEAKILAVADVVEAMSSHRPYRPALGIDKALEEISRKRGSLYDPEVVDSTLWLYQETPMALMGEACQLNRRTAQDLSVLPNKPDSVPVKLIRRHWQRIVPDQSRFFMHVSAAVAFGCCIMLVGRQF